MAGDTHTGVVLADGSVACWGDNRDGECNIPDDVGNPNSPVERVATGSWGTAALLEIQATKPCPADLDGDGVVGGSDLGQLFIAWGACDDCGADLDSDGSVGGSDLGILFVAWGNCP